MQNVEISSIIIYISYFYEHFVHIIPILVDRSLHITAWLEMVSALDSMNARDMYNIFSQVNIVLVGFCITNFIDLLAGIE